MNENAVSSLRPGVRTANSAGHLRLWLQLLTRGRKTAVGRRCSTSKLELFIQLYQMYYIIGRCDFVLGQKSVLGEVIDAACYHSGLVRGG